MIINDMWYPLDTNKRTLRWARNADTLPPTKDLIIFMASFVVFPLVCAWNMCIGVGRAFDACAIILSMGGYLVYDRYNPVRKFAGVPLDGVRLQMLSGKLKGSLTDKSADTQWHEIVDDYLGSWIVRETAHIIARERTGISVDFFDLQEALLDLEKAADDAAKRLRVPTATFS